MPQPVSYNPGTPVSGSIQENNISYVVDGQQRNYRGGFGGLSWMSEVPAENNVIFIGNSTSLGRGPAGKPLFYPSYNNTEANIVYAVNTLPGSPRNFTTTGSAYNWAVTNNFFINNSNNPIPRINADGLVLYVDANQPSSYPQIGTSVYDFSGRNNNGTLFNNTGWNNNGWFTFDGTDDYINCGNNSSLAIVGDITIYALVYFNSFGGYNGIVGKTSANSVPASFDYYTNPSNPTFLSFLRGNGSAFTTVQSNQNISLNRWYQIAVTMNGTNVTHYLNGTSNGTGILSTTVGDNGDPVLIGNRGDFFTDMNGSISSVQIYSRALTTAEIKQNYFQSNIVQDGLVLMADASNLVSYPKSGTTTYNLTGSLTGSLLNGVGFTQENGGNWTFDGVDDRISFQSPFGDVDWGTTAFTVTGWIKVDSPNDNDWCLLSSATNSNLIFGTLPYPAGNSLYVYGLRNSLGSPNNQVFNFFASNLWPNGYFRDTWLHVTLTYNGNGLSLGNFAIYSNGVSRTLNNGGSAGYSNANVIQLGRSTYGTGPTEYPNLMVYNRALTATEVAQNYEATKYKFQGQQIVTNGLVLNLDAANKDSYPGTGTTWTDLSGNANNGTLINGPSFSIDSGGCIDFDGIDDSVAGNKPVLSAVTLEYYCKLTGNSTGGYPHLVMSGNTFIGFVGNTSSARFRIAINPGAGYSEITSDLLNPSATFKLYSMTYDGTTVKMFVNGVQQASTMNIASTFELMTGNAYQLSAVTTPSYDKAPNKMAAFRIYNRALSATEIAQNYNATKERFGL